MDWVQQPMESTPADIFDDWSGLDVVDWFGDLEWVTTASAALDQQARNDEASDGMNAQVQVDDDALMKALEQHGADGPTADESQQRPHIATNTLYHGQAHVSERLEDLSWAEDSDCSWTEADSQQEWHHQLRLLLQRFRESDDKTIITPMLRSHQRKQVHATASIWGLSHMSLGVGKEKRVLASKCEIATFSLGASHVGKRWNPPRAWQEGWIDPNIIKLHGISEPRELRFRNAIPLHEMKGAQYVASCGGPYGSHRALYVSFETSDDAAAVMAALNGASVRDADYSTQIHCTHYAYPEDSEAIPGAAWSVIPKNTALVGSHGRPLGSALNDFKDGLGSKRSEKQTTSRKHRPPVAMRNRGHRGGVLQPRSYASDSENTDATGISQSSLDSDYSTFSSASKKRKRQPMIAAGYPCTWAKCDLVFDHEGQRRKHEKHHCGPRPYVCAKCGKAFMYPKDLRRHENVHGGEPHDLPLEPRQKTPSESKGLHGFGKLSSAISGILGTKM